MTKFSGLFICLFLLNSALCMAQFKSEREHRIRASQIPEVAHASVASEFEGIRRLRYYRETDSSITTYSARFKKDRLYYRALFDIEGNLEKIGVFIDEIDIPNESLGQINTDLEKRFAKYRVRKIIQQYPRQPGESDSILVRNAFQNLLLPTIRYELLVSGKKSAVVTDFNIRYDAAGNFLSIKNSIPANHDHVLY